MKYQKRIHWDRHRPEFLKIGFIFALAIALMAFNYTSEMPEFEVMEMGEPLGDDILIVPPPTIQKKRVLPPPPKPKISEVLEIEPVDEPVVTFEKEAEIKEDVKTIIDEYANDPVPETAPIVEIEIENEPDDTPVVMAERMPIYGNCSVDTEEAQRRDCTSQNLINHIYSNVKYPASARENDVQGTVVVSFIVNKNGDVESIDILRDIGLGCGDEVRRVIKKLGKFLPGKQNGRPVSVIYRLPVKFSLQ